MKFGGYPMKAISFVKVRYSTCDGSWCNALCVELFGDGACWKAYL